MKSSQITVVLLYLTAGAYAKCFTRGDDGPGGGDGQKGAGLTEKDVIGAVANLLKGNYMADEERTQCAMDTLGNKWKFLLKNTKKQAGWLSSWSVANSATLDEVKDWLGKEAYGCQYGGKNDKGGFHVMSDPNPGNCVSSNSPARRDSIPMDSDSEPIKQRDDSFLLDSFDTTTSTESKSPTQRGAIPIEFNA